MAKTAPEPAPEPVEHAPDAAEAAGAKAADLVVVRDEDLFVRNTWAGLPHFECAHVYPATGRRCVFDTFDETAMHAHVQWHLAGEPAENVNEES